MKTADGDFDMIDGFVLAPKNQGIGVKTRLDVLCTPLMSFN